MGQKLWAVHTQGTHIPNYTGLFRFAYIHTFKDKWALLQGSRVGEWEIGAGEREWNGREMGRWWQR